MLPSVMIPMGFNLKYRHIKKNDFKNIHSYVTDSHVSKYLTWKSYNDKLDVLNYIDNSTNKIAFPDEVLAIENDRCVIGTVHIIFRPSNVAQFGFGIVPLYWGNGLGLIIIADMVAHIKNSLWQKKCNVIWACVHEENIWVQKQLLKYGFTREQKEIEPKRYRFVFAL